MSDIDDLFQEINRKGIFFKKGNIEKKVQAYKSIAELGTPSTASHIFRNVFSLNGKLANQVAKTIHDLMLKVKQSQWTQLYHSFMYVDIYAKQLPHLCSFPEPFAVELLGIASLNWDGRLREKAICKLQEIDSPRKIPYIMLRLGDWAPQVREAAETAINECLKEGYADSFMSYTYILDWMKKVERVDLSYIHDRIIDYLNDSCSREHLQKVLEHPDSKVRFFTYRALLSKSPKDVELNQKWAKDSCPRIRCFILQNVQSFEAEDMIQYLPLFLKDSSPRICSSAMMAIPEDKWQDFRDVVFEGIFSKSTAIRNTARYLLKKHGFDAFADEYRSKIKSNQISPGIIYGLAETGTKEDFALLKDYIYHQQAKTRSAAIAGLYRLDAEQSIPLLITSLRDSIKRVRRTSSEILCKHGHFDRHAVRCILRNASSATKISALKILCDSTSWESLIDILKTISDEDEKVRNAAWHYFVKWVCKRSANNWAKPSHADLCAVEAKIEELNSKSIEIPDLAQRWWTELPILIESGKEIWKY